MVFIVVSVHYFQQHYILLHNSRCICFSDKIHENLQRPLTLPTYLLADFNARIGISPCPPPTRRSSAFFGFYRIFNALLLIAFCFAIEKFDALGLMI